MRTRFVHQIVSSVMLVFLTSCPDNSGTFTPNPELKFTNITLTQSRANAGDQIQISWDYENPELLKSQNIQGLSLLFQGISISQPAPLELGDRTFAFEFTGPITVVLTAEDEDTIDDDTTTADSVAFDILLDENAFFTLEYRPVNTATEVPGAPSAASFNFPRLGADDFAGHQIRFSQFVGFFDRPSVANGIVDELEPFLDDTLSFRALSRSVLEADAFKMEEGSRYPFLSESVPGFGLANACVYGGAIAYNGESIPIKADDDSEFTGRHAGTLTFEPIFMCVVLLVGFQSETVDIVDIQLGNLPQGFVASLTTGTLNNGGELLRGIFGSTSFNITNTAETVGTISGSIKGADIGFGVTALNGDIFDSIVRITSADWSMPFLFDTDLNSRLAFQP
ncbi:MAG: hypothetical protein SGI88_18545 [Candidatus Hydrogenedentes bacterium]|nr:hypothetical protein [Candidatus Hydrogenedentota bacterium]